jgi:hypothetical protein
MLDDKFRYQCAVRQLLIYRHKWGLKEFRKWVNQEKNIIFWLKYQDDFIIQWKLGNRGEKGRWLECQ